MHWVLDLTPEGVDLKIRHELDFVAPTEFGPPGCSQPDHSELIQAFWSVAVDNLRHFLANAVPLLLPVHRLGEREVSIAIWLDAPPARVFAALLDPDAMRDWMSAEAPVCEPRVGGRYDYGWVVESEQGRVPGGPRSILAMRQDQLLEHDWFWPDEPNSIVRWTLTPERGGTRLHLHHRGLDQDPGNYELGWLQGLFDLRRTLGGGISHA